MNRLMRKPTIFICETKAQISFAVTAKLISAFVFSTRIVQFLFYLNPNFQASSSFLCLYRPVCVGPVQKPHCWFSHKAAQFNLSFPSSESPGVVFSYFFFFFFFFFFLNEPPRGKTNNVVSEQVRHKPACTSTENS